MRIFSVIDRKQSAIFWFRLLLSTHCRCRGILLHLITRNDTHTHSRWDSSWREIGSSQWPLSAQHKTFTRDKYPCTPAGFETAIPAVEWLQTYVLECRATWIGVRKFENINFALNHNGTKRHSFCKQSGKCSTISIWQKRLPEQLPAVTLPFCAQSPAGDLCTQ